MNNKNQAMLEFLSQYPAVQSFLFFNSASETLGNTSIQTVYSETWEKRYTRGHGMKQYDFAIVQMVPQDGGTNHNNAEQMQSVQDFMNWIEEQNKARNLPEFTGCQVLSIENLQNMPNLADVNKAGNIAKYMFQCRVRYYE